MTQRVAAFAPSIEWWYPVYFSALVLVKFPSLPLYPYVMMST